MHSFVKAALGTVIVSVVQSACATVHVQVPVTRPAEIDMSQFHQVAIDPLTGPYADQVSATVQAKLVAAQRFDVVDREHVRQIEDELKRAASAKTHATKHAALGQQYGATAMIFGKVEAVQTQTPVRWTDCSNKTQSHRCSSRDGRATLRASFNVIDVSTGKVLTTKVVSAQRTATIAATDTEPGDVDFDALITQVPQAGLFASLLVAQPKTNMIEEVAQGFATAIIPTQFMRDVAFRKDDALPQLQEAILYAKNGNWAKAQSLVSAAISDAQNNPKVSTASLGAAYWDLGLMEECAGNYAGATADVQKAFDLTKEEEFLRELNVIQKAASDDKKLQEQNAAAAAPAS